MLGLEAPDAAPHAGLRNATPCPAPRGCTFGRTSFAPEAAAWLAGGKDDATAITDMADRFARLVAAWTEARPAAF